MPQNQDSGAELDQVLEQARQTPLSDPHYRKLKDTLHLLVGLLQPTRSTEKTSAVLEPKTTAGTGTPTQAAGQPRPRARA